MIYSELVTTVQDYTENDEASFLARIPVFTELAEERIFRILEGPVTEDSVSGVLTADSASLSAPEFFLRPLHFVVEDGGIGYFLTLRDTSWMRAAYPASSARGRPRYYSIANEGSFT